MWGLSHTWEGRYGRMETTRFPSADDQEQHIRKHQSKNRPVLLNQITRVLLVDWNMANAIVLRKRGPGALTEYTRTRVPSIRLEHWDVFPLLYMSRCQPGIS